MLELQGWGEREEKGWGRGEKGEATRGCGDGGKMHLIGGDVYIKCVGSGREKIVFVFGGVEVSEVLFMYVISCYMHYMCYLFI